MLRKLNAEEAPTLPLRSATAPTLRVASQLRVAIVGGGITGAAAAHTLCDEPDVELHVFDQGGRGPGGRASHRRVSADGSRTVLADDDARDTCDESTYEFDHGCQFFRADSTQMQAVTQQWCEAGWAAPWRARFGRIHPGTPAGVMPVASQLTADFPARPHEELPLSAAGTLAAALPDFFGIPGRGPVYIGVGGMHQLPRALLSASGASVARATRVSSVTRDASGQWLLQGSMGTAALHDTAEAAARAGRVEPLGLFDVVLLTDTSSSLGGWHRASANVDVSGCVSGTGLCGEASGGGCVASCSGSAGGGIGAPTERSASAGSTADAPPVDANTAPADADAAVPAASGSAATLVSATGTSGAAAADAAPAASASTSAISATSSSAAATSPASSALDSVRCRVRVPLFTAIVALSHPIAEPGSPGLPYDAFTVAEQPFTAKEGGCPGVARGESSLVSPLWFAARSQSKPGFPRAAAECWTLVSTPAYAASQISSTPMQDPCTGAFRPQDDVYLLSEPGPALFQAFLDAVRPTLHKAGVAAPTAVYLHAQRWGSALPAPAAVHGRDARGFTPVAGPGGLPSCRMVCGVQYAAALPDLVYPRPSLAGDMSGASRDVSTKASVNRDASMDTSVNGSAGQPEDSPCTRAPGVAAASTEVGTDPPAHRPTAAAAVGTATPFGGADFLQVGGGLFYSGDFCSVRNPGFEAAALSGIEAASHIKTSYLQSWRAARRGQAGGVP